MNSFFDFKETGPLTLDKIFFESYYPLLFTCINKNKEIYLCVCCRSDAEIRKWLLTNVSADTIIEMLSDKITLRDSFLKENGNKFTIIYDSEQDKYTLEENNEVDWDAENSIFLPTPGEYMEVEEDEFDEEIAYFKSLKHIIINSNYYNASNYINLSFEEEIVIDNEFTEYPKHNNFETIVRTNIIVDAISKSMDKNYSDSLIISSTYTNNICGDFSPVTNDRDLICISNKASNLVDAA